MVGINSIIFFVIIIITIIIITYLFILTQSCKLQRINYGTSYL